MAYLKGIWWPSAVTFSTLAYGIEVEDDDDATWVTSFCWWFAFDVFLCRRIESAVTCSYIIIICSFLNMFYVFGMYNS